MPDQQKNGWKDFLMSMTFPWLFMSLSACKIPKTVYELISAGDFHTLFSFSAFRDALFGNFWAEIGPMVNQSAKPRVIPLLEGRVSGGRIGDEVVGTPLHGNVLEIGAGSGMWVDVLASFTSQRQQQPPSSDDVKARKTTANASSSRGHVTKILGVEPHPQSAAALRRRVKEAGLEGVYEVAPVGIEHLSDPTKWAGQIKPGSIDSIVTVMCLCSIPEPEKNVKLLYDLLKPGGTWYVYEHVRSERGAVTTRLYQRIVNIPWSFFIGSCRLLRPTASYLKEAGTWSQVDLAHPIDEPSFTVVPHYIGTLTK